MYIALLGRQPALSTGELERVYGTDHVSWFSDASATVETDHLSIERLGGSLKAGHVVASLPHGDWRQASIKIVQQYTKTWATFDGKITLGISAYGFDTSPRDIQKTGIVLKQKLKQSGVSLRLIPNSEPALSTATSHHNKLGLSNNHVELLVFRSRAGKIIIAESIGAQNITALAKRDQERPKRDAFVGMLPPKLAQIMINLAAPLPPVSNDSYLATDKHLQPELEATTGPDFKPGAKPFISGNDANHDHNVCILDPFCGTGVILQEAALMGYDSYGTDLSEKMIRYSEANLQWLQKTHHIQATWKLAEDDAMIAKWQQAIDAVVCESYLGQPFSAPPSSAKLIEVRGNCNHIISTFLKNVGSQIKPGTPLCIAVPAWRDTQDNFTHLPLIDNLEKLGYQQVTFKNIRIQDLLYYRPDQVVARELLVLIKI